MPPDARLISFRPAAGYRRALVTAESIGPFTISDGTLARLGQSNKRIFRLFRIWWQNRPSARPEAEERRLFLARSSFAAADHNGAGPAAEVAGDPPDPQPRRHGQARDRLFLVVADLDDDRAAGR